VTPLNPSETRPRVTGPLASEPGTPGQDHDGPIPLCHPEGPAPESPGTPPIRRAQTTLLHRTRSGSKVRINLTAQLRGQWTRSWTGRGKNLEMICPSCCLLVPDAAPGPGAPSGNCWPNSPTLPGPSWPRPPPHWLPKYSGGMRAAGLDLGHHNEIAGPPGFVVPLGTRPTTGLTPRRQPAKTNVDHRVRRLGSMKAYGAAYPPQYPGKEAAHPLADQRSASARFTARVRWAPAGHR